VSDSTKVKATISELVVAFPAAFTFDPLLVRPVKLGIKDDLCAESTLSRSRISEALRSYCHTVPYLTASTEGAVRIDLNAQLGRHGEPTPAGRYTRAE
jgi:ProP effector